MSYFVPYTDNDSYYLKANIFFKRIIRPHSGTFYITQIHFMRPVIDFIIRSVFYETQNDSNHHSVKGGGGGGGGGERRGREGNDK